MTGSRDLAVDVNDTPDVVGRLCVSPLRGLGPWLQGLQLGVSATWGEGPIRHGFRVRTVGYHTLAEPPTIRGTQLRLAGHLEWRLPRLRLAGEVHHLRQEREGVTSNQQVDGAWADVSGLSSYELLGWYGELDWHVLGRASDDTPESGLELVARFESLDFGDGDSPLSGEDTSPLADSWLEAITMGANWYFPVGVRLSLAWQGLRVGDASLVPDFEEGDSAKGAAWAHHVLFRTQWSL